MTAALSTPPSSRPSAKNRTRVISVIGEKHVGARGAAARGPHWAFRSLEGKTASANTVHENWNRFYDPSTGRYLSPEPLLQDPDFIAESALDGQSVSAYAYALNNPINYVDEDGLQVSVPFPTTVPWSPAIPAPSPWLGPIMTVLWPSDTAVSTCWPNCSPVAVEQPWSQDWSQDVCEAKAGDGVQEHTKNKRPSNWEKHSKKRAGAKEKKDQRMPYRGKNGKKK